MMGTLKLRRRGRQEKQILLEVTLTCLTLPLELVVVNPLASSLEQVIEE